ncbi:MAG: phytoene desaturase [Cytophagales bacterium]|nr:phytoene desaturase [Cytophagales bacterium]
MKIAVVGAGMGGLSAAIRLAVAGNSVEVYEANTYPGGKLSEIQLDGYRFDAGPSLFTLPELVDELFTLAGKNPKDYFSYQRLPVICNYFYEDGTEFTAKADPKKFAEDLASMTGEPANQVTKFLAHSRKLYELTNELFLKSSIHKVSTYLNANAFKTLLNLPRLNLLQTMNKENEHYFKNPKAVQLFNRYATYNGSDPYQVPATFNVIPHLEYNLGAYFPDGGMHSITKSLVRLAEELGVKFHLGARVEQIVTEKSMVKGIQVNGTFIPADVVVSNSDISHTYRKLLPQEKAPEKLLSQPKSSSAIIFYWGIKESFPQLDLHNIFFSGDYKNEFEYIFKKGEVCDDPTVYVNISSKCQSSDAPEGCENWFVMINVPNNSGQNWDEIIQRSKANILKKLSSALFTDISKRIVCEAVLDPRTIESRTSSFAGALYGNSSNNTMAAFLRHANFSSRIKNLYFTGGSVHPGGGIPLALLSGKIVADLIKK